MQSAAQDLMSLGIKGLQLPPGNDNAIPNFAAYFKEGCHQEMDYLEAYSPYAVFRRKEGDIEIEVVGNMLRPWLDGIRPE